MTVDDLAAVDVIAAKVHPNFPEDVAVPAERLRLAPAGCYVLADDNGIVGYVVSHPWRAFPPPKLNTLLGALPEPPACWYIHDLALMPTARGRGHAGAIVERLAAVARQAGLRAMSLTAVSGSAPFWARHGFVVETGPEIAAALASYGADAAFMMRHVED